MAESRELSFEMLITAIAKVVLVREFDIQILSVALHTTIFPYNSFSFAALLSSFF
ncbi:MAG: hypothetical protein AB7V56_15160 [Candidatus Nitrosocosmicus sp.]|nr:hypothetical protein [Candidatus Nitrosocosmicus sp.]